MIPVVTPDQGVRRGAYISAPAATTLALAGLVIGVVAAALAAFASARVLDSRTVAEHALALHHADEAIRWSSAVRSQSALAIYFGLLGGDLGVEDDGAVDVAIAEARRALAVLEETMARLQATSDASVQASAVTFSATVSEMLGALEGEDLETARDLATESLEDDYRAFVDLVIIERDHHLAAVGTASARAGAMNTALRWLAAFLVPAVIIIGYAVLAERRRRRWIAPNPRQGREERPATGPGAAGDLELDPEGVVDASEGIHRAPAVVGD